LDVHRSRSGAVNVSGFKILDHYIGQATDGGQGRLEVVGGAIGETQQFFVGLPKLGFGLFARRDIDHGSGGETTFGRFNRRQTDFDREFRAVAA
jgi:hypothetical protein